MDFHYYGTYAAARIAGFSLEEATTIAHAAQYVDDSTRGRILNPDKNRLPFAPIPTCMSMGELAKNYLLYRWISWPDSDLRQAWVPFHFLPGNYQSTVYEDENGSYRTGKVGEYGGPRASSKWEDDTWIYDEEAKKEFKLICLPRSPLAAEMVNQRWERQKRPGNWLHKLGIMVHVYADTYAHMFFAGMPARHVNDVFDPVQNVDYEHGGTLTTILWWGNVEEFFDHFWEYFNQTKEMCVPGSKDYHSSSYLGHGRVGHVPDQPWRSFKFKPEWHDNNKYGSLAKNNPDLFLLAFLEMILILNYQNGLRRDPIKYGKNEGVIDTDVADLQTKLSDIRRQIGEVLQCKPGNANDYDAVISRRILCWKNLLNQYNLGVPVAYDPDAWVTAAKQSNDIEETDYYKFNRAAIEHSNFVRNRLLKDKMLADWEEFSLSRWYSNDLTNVSNVRVASSKEKLTLAAYAFEKENTMHVIFVGQNDHIYELAFVNGKWGYTDLTPTASLEITAFPPMTNLVGYVLENNNSQHVIYVRQDGNIHELYWIDKLGHTDLTSATKSPYPHLSPLAGYAWENNNSQHVVYVAHKSGHIYELYWINGKWGYTDLTAASAPLPSCTTWLAGYAWENHNSQHVNYVGQDDGHIHELWYYNGKWEHTDLTKATGNASQTMNPKYQMLVSYVLENNNSQHVNYVGQDGHIHELYCSNGKWGHTDLTIAAIAPIPSDKSWLAAHAFEKENTGHVDYVGQDGHIHELWFSTVNGEWSHIDLYEAARKSNASPQKANAQLVGYAWENDKTQHVIYLGTNYHIYEHNSF